MRHTKRMMDALSPPHHAAASSSSSPPGETDGLYAKLWQACAGPCVNVPQTGEPVFYFPQGHLEQVAAFTQLDGYVEIPTYGLPPKIFCKVVSVRLKAEAHTDEVFAELTLIPEPKQEKVSSGGKDSRVLPSRTKAATILSKTLTQSDTSTHGGFSIPKRLADECFPPLDMSQQPPAQELVMKDLHGDLWNFRHIYRGQPKRHLLTSGWSTFVNMKKLAAGDTCIFLRGEDGELRIGIRRAKKQHNTASTSVISGHSMQLGILATASFAVTTGTMFTVYYRPWTNPCEFIIPLDRYMTSTKRKYSLGMRIQMQFEAEESTRRYAGTIIGIDEIDGRRWPGSEWRNLKVQWDAMPDTNIRADRVSPWNIEPLESTRNNIPNLPPPKRPRVPSPSLPVLCGSTQDVQHASQRSERDLQGQDYNEVGSQPNAQKRILTDAPLLSNTKLNGSQSRMKNQLHFQLQNPLCHSLGSSASFPDDDISISSLPKQPPVPTTYETCNVSVPRCFSNSKVNSIDSESQVLRASESRDESEVPFGQPAGYGRNEYKLFGVRLNHTELPSQQLAASSNTSSLPPMSESSISASITVTEPSKSVSGVTSQKKCKKCCSVNNRSCTKVLKHGSALGRSVDLSCFRGYDELISELDSMFDFKGGLINGSSGWHVIPIDFEGDYMLFDDYTWQDFQWAVQKMIICPKEDTNNLNVNASTTDSTNM